MQLQHLCVIIDLILHLLLREEGMYVTSMYVCIYIYIVREKLYIATQQHTQSSRVLDTPTSDEHNTWDLWLHCAGA